MKTNSTIFKNPEDNHLIDLTYLGTMLKENSSVQIEQKSHFFVPGDVLAYSLEQKKFIRAIAENTIRSEVCGVVSKYIDQDNFELVVKGSVEASQYQYPNGSKLYLSEVIPGKLNSVMPTKTFREIATQTSPGIIEVSIKMGSTMGTHKEPSGILEPYTQDELDEIIANLM